MAKSEPVVLDTVAGRMVLVNPEDVVKVEEMDRGTVIVTNDYSLYHVREDPEEIKELMLEASKEEEEGDSG